MCSFLCGPATPIFQNGEWKHVAETVSFLLSVRANHVEVYYFGGLDGLHAATLANAKGIFRVLNFRGCVLTKITCICCTGQGDDSAAPKRSQNRSWCRWFDCWRLANIGRQGKILDFFGKIQCYCGMCFNSSIKGEVRRKMNFTYVLGFVVLRDVAKVFQVRSPSFARKTTGRNRARSHSGAWHGLKTKWDLKLSLSSPTYLIRYLFILVGTTTPKLKLDAFKLWQLRSLNFQSFSDPSGIRWRVRGAGEAPAPRD